MAAFKSIRNIFSPKKPGDDKVNGSDKNIDYNMQLAAERERRTIRILLLGPGDSGKTTIVKQMKKIHQTLHDTDIELMAPYIQDAVVGYAKLLCYQAKELNEKYDEKTQIEEKNESIRNEILSLNTPYELNEELAAKITKIWADPGIKTTLSLRHKFQIHDNVDYFLENIDRVCTSSYIPTFEDYIRIRTRSTGFAIDRVNTSIDKFGSYSFEFTDVGGQRSERKKWMKIVCDNIHAVLYIVALSEYNLKCFEDNQTNRLHEALNLFKEIVNGQNGKFFQNKSVLVFFNKYDLFKEKIKTIPITVAFDDYPSNEKSPHDENEVVRFVAAKFLKCFDGKNINLATPLHIHRTSALDTDNIQKLFRDITLDLVKLNLKNCGML